MSHDFSVSEIGQADPMEQVIRVQASLFRALSDSHRLKILSLLSSRGEMSVMDIGKLLNQSQPAVSHHLRELRAVGLIDYRRDGKFNYYHLYEAGIQKLFETACPSGGYRLVIAGLELIVKPKS